MSFLDSRTPSAPKGFGQPVRRTEDARLLTGGGRYSDDVNLQGQAFVCFVRSPHAHAKIGRVETAAALATPGVLAFSAPHPPIPADRVRFVGEIVAMVVAETSAAARDGAERVTLDWAPLPAAPASLAAAAPDAPILYEGSVSNVCVETRAG